MVEYVYARHDFVPEHDDEIPFRAGERIEVVEKDEQYEDGWWQVCSRSLCSPISITRVPFASDLCSLFSSAHPHFFLEAARVPKLYSSTITFSVIRTSFYTFESAIHPGMA